MKDTQNLENAQITDRLCRLSDKLLRMPDSVLNAWFDQLVEDCSHEELELALECSDAKNLENLERWQEVLITAVLIEIAGWYDTLPMLVQDIDRETLQGLYLDELFSVYTVES